MRFHKAGHGSRSKAGVRHQDHHIGVVLGESAALFAVRAWSDRDEMYRRMRDSSLFTSELVPPYDAARTYWVLPPGQTVFYRVSYLDLGENADRSLGSGD